MSSKLNHWERVTWDVTTGHATKEDGERMTRGEGPCRCAPHEYGWILFPPCGLDRRERAIWLHDQRADGWSNAILRLLLKAMEGDVSLVCFDGDADAHPDFPTFDW